MDNSFRRKYAQPLVLFVAILILISMALYVGGRKNFGLQQYAQLSLDGLLGGAIYTLIEVSLPNWVHLLGSVIFAILVTTLIGVLVERFTIYPARSTSTLTLIIITVGVYITLQGLALVVWGSNAYVFPAFTTLEMSDKTFRWFGLVIKAQSFWIWGSMILVLVALAYFFERTLLGKAMRACSVNRRGARLVGIGAEKMSLLAFGMAAAVGAIGGIVVAPILRPSYDMGLALGLKGFVAAILGGLVSTPGAVLGGLLLGFLENVAAGVTKAGMKDIYAFILLILTLLFRPQGLLGVRKTAVESSGEDH